MDFKKLYDRIFIFGAGGGCKVFLEFFGDRVREYINAILVSDKKSNPEKIFDLPVVCLSDIAIKDDDLVIVSLLSEDTSKVNDMLKGIGIKNVISIRNLVPLSREAQNGYELERDHEIKRYKGLFFKEKKLFKYIEIETVNRCNGDCGFCPVNRNETQREYKKMDRVLFEKIIGQLEELNYDGLLALFSNNEPFLDDRIFEFTKYARTKLPKAYIYLYTNGKLLSEDKFKTIIESLDFIQIDNYEPDLGKSEEICKIEEYVKQWGIQKKYNYFEIDKNAIRLSRGGTSPNLKVWYTSEVGCALPFVQMVIRPTGEVSLCCNDALGKNTLGDLNKQTITEVWFSERYNQFRKQISENRYNVATCRYCNYVDKRDIWGRGSIDESFILEEHLFPTNLEMHRDIYFLGTDITAIRTCKELRCRGFNVKAFFDFDRCRWNQKIVENIMCLPIKEIENIDKDSNLIIKTNVVDADTYRVLHEFEIKRVFWLV
ncbi:MAG: SPASM domain-containing protein [Lachnospiraceae bacterium]|nr:SPASM domain-containing protein [Lachnospiraceae bacterium]